VNNVNVAIGEWVETTCVNGGFFHPNSQCFCRRVVVPLRRRAIASRMSQARARQKPDLRLTVSLFTLYVKPRCWVDGVVVAALQYQPTFALQRTRERAQRTVRKRQIIGWIREHEIVAALVTALDETPTIGFENLGAIAKREVRKVFMQHGQHRGRDFAKIRMFRSTRQRFDAEGATASKCVENHRVSHSIGERREYRFARAL
jgi:hypothetical protein